MHQIFLMKPLPGKSSSNNKGIKKLYFHSNHNDNPLYYSTSSSLISDKKNVNKSNFENVQVLALTEYIDNLNKGIYILKIDIEGEEVNLLEELIGKEVYKRIKYIFVEPHQKQIQSLDDKFDELNKLIKTRKITNIYLNWT